jgi:hypothetical protein
VNFEVRVGRYLGGFYSIPGGYCRCLACIVRGRCRTGRGFGRRQPAVVDEIGLGPPDQGIGVLECAVNRIGNGFWPFTRLIAIAGSRAPCDLLRVEDNFLLWLKVGPNN